MTFTFTAEVAWDPNGRQNVKNVSFQVFAVTDTGFTTPLPITDTFGVPLPGNILNSGNQGTFPSFQQATNPVVVLADSTRTYAWTLNCVPSDAAVAAFINTGGSATAAALSATYVQRKQYLFNVKDYGAKGDGTTDDSAAFVAANNDAAQVNGTVVIPGSANAYIVDNLTITNMKAHWMGIGSPIMGSADGTTTTKAGAVLRRKASSTNPLLTVSSNGVQLENLYLDGNSVNGASGSGLVILRGFEVKLTKIFVEFVNGVGLDIQGADNTNFYDVFVNKCGTTTLPSVQILVGATANISINTLDFTGLTIEQPPGPALSIGVGATALYPEFLRITNLHVELDNRYTGFAQNTGPLINIANCRSVCLVNPFIVSGPGPLIQYNRTQGALGDVLGGLQIIGGSLLGRTDAGNTTPTLVNLIAGNGFIMTGTRVDSATSEAVKVQSTFGNDVQITAISSVAANVPKILSDLRATPTVVRSNGDYILDAHVSAGSTATLTVAAGAQAGTTPPAPAMGGGANDIRGAVFFGTGTTPGAGAMFKVTFNRAYATAPTVVVTAGNLGTANLGAPYTSSTTTDFTVYVPNIPAASQGGGTYFMQYLVMG